MRSPLFICGLSAMYQAPPGRGEWVNKTEALGAHGWRTFNLQLLQSKKCHKGKMGAKHNMGT